MLDVWPSTSTQKETQRCCPAHRVNVNVNRIKFWLSCRLCLPRDGRLNKSATTLRRYLVCYQQAESFRSNSTPTNKFGVNVRVSPGRLLHASISYTDRYSFTRHSRCSRETQSMSFAKLRFCIGHTPSKIYTGTNSAKSAKMTTRVACN